MIKTENSPIDMHPQAGSASGNRITLTLYLSISASIRV